jgi:hypothetical protein
MVGAVAPTLPERHQERLCGEVVGQPRADPPLQVAMDRRVVTVKQLGKAGGLGQRRGDQLGVLVRQGLLAGRGAVTRP